jgi:GNAT superfamily N-acetyltransferase
MDQVSVRDANRADAHAIAQIHVETWQATYRGLLPDAHIDRHTVESRGEFWSGLLSRATPSRVSVAEIGGAIVGFCSYGPTRDDDADAAEIYAIYVNPRAWRRGAGRALCSHALREAAGREHRAMTLWALDGNDHARRFYESMGFRPDGATRGADERTEIRYRKVLA